MPNVIRLKPAAGLLVRNPQRGHRPLAADGEDVTLDEYFIRRLREGDVVEVKAGAETSSPPKPAKK